MKNLFKSCIQKPSRQPPDTLRTLSATFQTKFINPPDHPTQSRKPPDTFQTYSRHPLSRHFQDTFQTSPILQERPYLGLLSSILQVYFQCFKTISGEDTLQTPSRHRPDTLKTPSRHLPGTHQPPYSHTPDRQQKLYLATRYTRNREKIKTVR